MNLTIDDFIGNKFTVKKIIENVEKGLNVTIFGPIGSGKTTLCKLILQKLDRPILEVNKETKDIIHSIKTFLRYRTIDNFIENNYKSTHKFVVIEDIENCISIDKSLLTSLINDVFPKKVQLLITCGNDFQLKKKLQDAFKDRCEFSTLSYPSQREIICFLSKKTNLDNKVDHIKKLIINHKGCIRDILMHLDFNVINEISQLKDLNTFDMVKYLFSTSMVTQNDIMYIYQNDSCNILHTILENIPEELLGHRCSQITSYIKLLDMFIGTGHIETYAFCNAEWKLFDLVAMIRLIMIKDILNGHMMDPLSTHAATIRHSQMLSKISHHNIFNKKLQSYKEKYMVDEYVLLHSLQENKDETYITTTYKKYFQPIQ